MKKYLFLILMLILPFSRAYFQENPWDSVNQKLFNLQITIAQINQTNKELTDEIAGLNKQLVDTQNNLNDSETTVAEQQKKIDDLTLKIADLTKQVEDNKKVLAQKQKEYDAAIAQIKSDHTKEVDKLKSDKLIWQIVAGVCGAGAIAALTYALIK